MPLSPQSFNIKIFPLVLFFLICYLLMLTNSNPINAVSFPLTPQQTTNNSLSLNGTTPIDHLVIIFQENISFDHYFGTYPYALNLENETPFYPSSDTPSVNGLANSLLYNNTNLSDPFRMSKNDSEMVALCGNNHTYTAIQRSYNSGFMDKFVEANGEIQEGCNPNLPMGYFDGNTVTALWSYAQKFSMSDNFHSTIAGPSLPGHINLISGQTHGVIPENLDDNTSNGTLIGDVDSFFDGCSNGSKVYMTGTNIGDLLNEKNITWGWFSGGFQPTFNSTLGNEIRCGSSHINIAGNNITDYVVHHEPFQYYKSTANTFHHPPSSTDMIGHSDIANHQYDLIDFWNAVENGNIPSVSFLKAPYYQTGHTKASDPVNEQKFLVDTINKLQNTSQWDNMAIIIAYDDTGGWYDHEMPPIIMQSNDPRYDAIAGTDGLCGSPDKNSYLDRCGYGGRLPLIIISPWAKVNYVDHQLTDQTSILRYIEDNWNLGRIGDNSFDEKAGSILNMFNFTKGHYAEKLFLNSTDGMRISTK